MKEDYLQKYIQDWRDFPQAGFAFPAKPLNFDDQSFPSISQIKEQFYSHPFHEIDCNDPLVEILETPKLKLFPVYALANLSGSKPTLYARKRVYELLLEVSESLPPNICLFVLDAYRTRETQNALVSLSYAILGNLASKYVYDERSSGLDYPIGPPPHTTGGAVDVTLGWTTGEFVDMAGSFDEMSQNSRTDFLDHSDITSQQISRRLLFYHMTLCGFSNYPEEWWHFDFGNHFWSYYRNVSTNKMYSEIIL